MLSTFGVTRAQAEKFIELYRTASLRAAAEESGLNIIQATMIARKNGCLRFTEAAIVNSKSGEIGRTGEEIFQKHFPEAVNCNLSVQMNNPYYDFILNGAKIDVKTSSGTTDRGGGKYVMRCHNKFKTDIFVLFMKEDAQAEIDDQSAYRHCLIIPSLFLLNSNYVWVSKAVLQGKKMAWSEYLFPVEKLRETLLMLVENPEMLEIPPELRSTAEANEKLKKAVRRAKKGAGK